MRIITLTTDFGNQDWFVGTMKGVILGINPAVTLVDLTHEVPPGNVRAAAFALAAGYSFFPQGTVHLAVVDPGVGTDRPAIAVATDRYLFVGPDNGILSLALARETVRAAHRLEDPRFFLARVSRTFHGRDVFAPIAAHLTRGALLEEFGPPHPDIHQVPWPSPLLEPDRMQGAIVYFDRFGNAVTNIRGEEIRRRGGVPQCRVGLRRVPLQATYQNTPKGQALAIIGSTDLLEISVNGYSAHRKLKLHIDQTVEMSWKKDAFAD